MKAESLVQVLNIFDPKRPLSTPEELESYFVERPRGALNEMKTYLEGVERPVKILFTGHRGSGKTTQLSKLTSLLEEKFFIVKFSITECLNLFDLNYVDVILATALRLFQRAAEERVGIKKELLQDVYDWLYNELTKEKVIEIPKGGSISANINLLALKVEGKFGAETSTRISMRERIERRIADLIERINLTSSEIKRVMGKELLIIIEDIDKTDLDRARHLFFEHGMSLLGIECRIIYTFPIALRYSNDFQQIARTFDTHFVLPNVKIFDKQGNLDETGSLILKDVCSRRMEEELIEPEALKEVIESSGGLMLDLIRLIQGAANYALSGDKERIDLESVERMANEIRNDYRALLQPKHYRVLQQTQKDKEKRIVNEEVVQELLHNLSLLEYRNDETWGDVHPIVKPLLR